MEGTIRMNKKILLLMMFIFLLGNEMIFAAAIPPQEFAVWNRLPSEGEVGYGYNALKKFTLKKYPRSNEAIASVETGEPVMERRTVALTHPKRHPVYLYSAYTAQSVHALPDNATSVNYNHMEHEQTMVIPAGATIYLLMYTGEGTFMGWYNNMIVEWIDYNHIKNFVTSNKINPPYMGEYMGDEPPVCEYWMELEKTNGEKGWIEDQEGILKTDRSRFEKITE